VGKYYERDADVEAVVAHTLEQYHQRLHTLGLKLSVLVVRSDDDEPGPALKHQGYGALAVIRVLNLKLRTLGLGDAEIVVDGYQWDELSRGRRVAVIDHELTHLEPIERGGVVQRDDLMRPKLRLRLHDYQVGGFLEVAKRHPSHAIEFGHFKQLSDLHVQLVLELGDDLVATALAEAPAE
jgi:hypothetical protein